jgi:uncharacterized SAM-binding protein YcdF (DUF218 family)
LPGLPAPRPLRQQKPARRRHPRRPPPRRPRRNWRTYAILSGIALCLALAGWAALARAFAPQANSHLSRFEAIIVLGYPADSDGNPTPEQLARVTEGVNEYMRGAAPRLILTGGAVRNRFVEAQVMARVAQSEGIPPSAILIEPNARDTLQNACYATRILRSHGWHSAEIVSSAYHLPRTALIFDRLPIQWRTHPAPPLAPQSSASAAWHTAMETLKTVRLLVYADWAERCEP